MSESQKVKRCKEPHCKVHLTGVCMETLNIEKDECPNFYLADYNQEELQGEKKVLRQREGIKLFEGKEMDVDETTELTHKYPTKLIAIVGEPACGKTTLLAELYNIFQKGPFIDLYFAGSHTLVGFEQRAHLSRVESNAEHPETDKTSSRVFSFLHLALKKKGYLEEKPIHMLLSDISGERFQLARDSSSIMKELNVLTDADHVIYIVDGEKLSNKKLRYQAIFNAETFIQTAIDNKILNRSTQLTVVVSKWDRLVNEPTFNFNEQLDVPFTNKFDNAVGSFKIFPVAARPKTGMITPGFGLYELLNNCYTMRKQQLVVGPAPFQQIDGRELYRLKTREEQ